MKSDRLIFEQLEIGPMQNFIYFIGDSVTRQIGVVDPGWDSNFIFKTAEKRQYQIVSLLLTHGHYDHTDAAAELQKLTNSTVYISKHESKFYLPDCPNMTFVDDLEIIKIGGVEIKCLHTPGHTPGSQCFYCSDSLMTGDTLFIDGCGRCDLPGGNAKTLFKSLREVILKLPDATIIYPGHDYGSTPYASLAILKKSNPYLCPDCDEFLHERMGM